MKAKVIRTEVSKDGIIHLADHDLPPGRVNVIILYDDTKSPMNKRVFLDTNILVYFLPGP